MHAIDDLWFVNNFKLIPLAVEATVVYIQAYLKLRYCECRDKSDTYSDNRNNV